MESLSYQKFLLLKAIKHLFEYTSGKRSELRKIWKLVLENDIDENNYFYHVYSFNTSSYKAVEMKAADQYCR